MTYQWVKRNNSQGNSSDQARPNQFAPRPYIPRTDTEQEQKTQQPKTYSGDSSGTLELSITQPTPTVQLQSSELEPDTEEQESKDTVKLPDSSHPTQPNNNNSPNQAADIQAKLATDTPKSKYEQKTNVATENITSENVLRLSYWPEKTEPKIPQIRRHNLQNTEFTHQQIQRKPSKNDIFFRQTTNSEQNELANPELQDITLQKETVPGEPKTEIANHPDKNEQENNIISELLTSSNINIIQQKPIDNKNTQSITKQNDIQSRLLQQINTLPIQQKPIYNKHPEPITKLINSEILPIQPKERSKLYIAKHSYPAAKDTPIKLNNSEILPIQPKEQSKLYIARQSHPAAKNSPKKDKNIVDIILGALAGEFNEDPHIASIVIDGIISFVPVLDQIADARDLTAHLYHLISKKEEYKNIWRWVSLAFSLIGCVPQVGTVIKSASKLLFKGTAQVLPHLKQLLKLISSILPNGSVGSFKKYLAQNWGNWVKYGSNKFNDILKQLSDRINLIPEIFGPLTDKKHKALNAVNRIKNSAPQMLKSAFDTIWRKISQVLDDIIKRINPQQIPPTKTPRSIINALRKNLSPKALKAVENLSEAELQKIIKIVNKSPKDASDILETYYIKCIKNKDKYIQKYGNQPPSAYSFLNDSIANRNIAIKRGYPFGFASKLQFQQFGNKIKSFLKDNGYPIDDIRIQGSANIKPTPGDIDIGVIVSKETFEEILKRSFKTPNPGSSKEKTMLHALATGKITAGDCRPKLSGLAKELQNLVGKEVDVSIILKGGEFDVGVTTKIP